ncbi:MAG TPA: redoxin domain-containing protein [Gemmataceae bacterium]|nr:redoxin domain-containing protein [Gemmataceae bacterium]
MANYVTHLQPELAVNYCQLVIVWTDDPASTRAARQQLGATFPFLCDHERNGIAELDIEDTTDASHPRIAIPYTFVLDGERVILRIYNGWWYVGRPTVEELRMDLRALMSRRRDWWYDDTPAPYARAAGQ